MEDPNINLEEILGSLPDETRYKTVVNILKTAEREDRSSKGRQAKEAKSNIPIQVLYDAFEYYTSEKAGSKEELSAIRQIVELEAVERKEEDLIIKGAEILEERAETAQADHIKHDFYFRSAELFMQVSNGENVTRAAKNYEKIECWKKAAEAWALINEPTSASICYEKAEDFENASEYALRSDDVDRAISLASRLEDKTLVVDISSRKDRYQEALGYAGDDIDLKIKAAINAKEHGDVVNFKLEKGEKREAAKYALFIHKSLEREIANYSGSELSEAVTFSVQGRNLSLSQATESSNTFKQIAETHYSELVQKSITVGNLDDAEEYAKEAEMYEKLVEIDLIKGDVSGASYYLRHYGDKIPESAVTELSGRIKALAETQLTEAVSNLDFSEAASLATYAEDSRVRGFNHLAEITTKD